MYLVITKLPDVGMKDIIVNFDTNTSIFARRSTTLGKVDIVFARDDTLATTYKVKVINLDINYIVAIYVDLKTLRFLVTQINNASPTSTTINNYYSKFKISSFFQIKNPHKINSNKFFLARRGLSKNV